MGYWKTSYRRINGKQRKVRKLYSGGKIIKIRIAKRINRLPQKRKIEDFEEANDGNICRNQETA